MLNKIKEEVEMKKKELLQKVLKKHKEDIKVQKDGELFSLADLTRESAGGVIATSMNGVIPLVEDIAPGSKNNHVVVNVCYNDSVFSVFEFMLKKYAKQTLLKIVPVEEYEDIMKGYSGSFNSVYERTNLQLILKEIGGKNERRIKNWAEESGGSNDLFILKVPDVVLFYGDIKKKDKSEASLFDIVIVFVKTEKSLKKLKKKDPSEFNKAMEFVVSKTASLLNDLSVESVHIDLDKRFYIDVHDYAKIWAEQLIKSSSEGWTLNRAIFCTNDANTMVSFNKQITSDLYQNSLSVM